MKNLSIKFVQLNEVKFRVHFTRPWGQPEKVNPFKLNQVRLFLMFCDWAMMHIAWAFEAIFVLLSPPPPLRLGHFHSRILYRVLLLLHPKCDTFYYDVSHMMPRPVGIKGEISIPVTFQFAFIPTSLYSSTACSLFKQNPPFTGIREVCFMLCSAV